MANSCLSNAAPCPRLPIDAAWTPQLQLQCASASAFSRPARAHRRLVAGHVSAPALPVPRRRRLAVVAMVSQEETAATAVEEGRLREHEQDQEGEQEGGVVEESSDGGSGTTEAASTTATKLYFGNLPYNCDSALLAGIVQDYASPEMVEVLYDRTTGRSRGFAFVTMTTIEDCELVITNLDGSLYGGRTMKVNFADRPKPKLPLYPETGHKLFVGNLSWTVTSEMLTETFQRCGNVVGARVLYDGDTGRSRGYGFVCYSTREEMDEALSSLNGMATRIDTSTGADTHPTKRLRAPPMRRMFTPRKPSPADPSKKTAQPASSSHATPVAPFVGVTGSTTLSAAEAWDYCWRTAEFLEGLKKREVDQEVLANNLKAAQKAQSDEKSARLRAQNSLAEEKAARQVAEQSLQQSNDANATLALELETAHTSLAATHNKLESKSKALDFQVIRADEAILRLKNAESRLKAAEEDLKNQRQLLESARNTSSTRKSSFNMMISSTVAHAAALFKNHLPDLNMKLLRQDFTMDDAERETLVSSAFDAAQDFVSSYDFTSLAESDDNDSPKAL